MMDWQPIETAPRDRNILIYTPPIWPGQTGVKEAWWKSPYEGAPMSQCSWETMTGTNLSADVHEALDGTPLGATHWMPLPPPPA